MMNPEENKEKLSLRKAATPLKKKKYSNKLILPRVLNTAYAHSPETAGFLLRAGLQLNVDHDSLTQSSTMNNDKRVSNS